MINKRASDSDSRASSSPPAGSDRQARRPPRDPIVIGDLEMRIATDGTWYYRGSPIQRKELVRLFASVLSRDHSGDYWLETPAERGRVEVEDAPFVAVALDVRYAGHDRELTFHTNIDEKVTAGPEHPIRVEANESTGEPRPYVLVRDRLEARIARSVYYDLVDLGHEEYVDGDKQFGIWSKGEFFSLGSLAETD